MLELFNISYDVKENQSVKEIVHDINLTIDDDSLVVITGPNGGGKSTLAKMIMGIEAPSSGKIIFNGKDVTHMDMNWRANEGMSFAFQQPIRFKGLTVHDLLGLAAGKKLNVEQACSYLSEVGMCAKDYIKREMNASLSGGELKRIEIAMVLAKKSALAIFDEPEAGIDLWSFHNLIHVFQKMRRHMDGSVVIISHQERILDIADRVIVIANGRVSADGTREEILPDLLRQSDTCDYYKGVMP